jgi:tryptophan synthase alpha chain
MNYQEAFANLKKKNEKALIPFVVAGDPDYETSLKVIKTIVESGADILELGFPFSDPVADGPTIQLADQRALNKGMNTDKCFQLIKDIRKFSQIPIGLLIYANLIYQRGIYDFYREASESGVNSVLIADLSVEESDTFTKAAKENSVDTVFIVSPLTEENRLKTILNKITGFVYLVSRTGVTGARNDLQKSTIELIKRVRHETNLPICVGFGISKPEHVRAISEAGADGAIVGSAIVKIIESNLDNESKMLRELRDYIKKMKAATRDRVKWNEWLSSD